jgi:hypothetical protein
MSVREADPPDELQSNTVEARVLKQKIWQRLWWDNEHFMGVIVGREGSGKSYTGLRICEVCDPSFSAERVMFDPEDFLRKLKEWKQDGETQGKMVLADEAGVGVGVRTWHDKAQIKFNQVLQVIRDENMGIIFTLPRLNELDSQTRGRLHAFMEMRDKEDGEWAELSYLNWDPTRDERDDIYRQYPQLRIGGVQRQVKRLKIGPPSDDLAAEYSEYKDEFQDELYEQTVEEMSDDEEEDKRSAQDIVDILKDEARLEEVVSYHNGHHKWQWDKDLIRAAFDCSHSKATTVKKLLDQDPGIDADQAAAQREAEA